MKLPGFDISYKVDINPSYEWANEAESLGISHRELEVFALITEGYSNKEVARILKIKHQSVKNHMHSFTKKINVRNNTQALVISLYMNLIKVRAKFNYKDTPEPFEITADTYLNGLRKYIGGETKVSGANEKTKQQIKVWLKEHGIDPYTW